MHSHAVVRTDGVQPPELNGLDVYDKIGELSGDLAASFLRFIVHFYFARGRGKGRQTILGGLLVRRSEDAVQRFLCKAKFN